jgi:hypothetical protein
MNTYDRRGAIVCYHVAKKGYPILFAKRDGPMYPEDSGWQFLCYSGEEEKVDEAQIWTVDEVLELEPSLRELIGCEPVTRLHRIDKTTPWQCLPVTDHGKE